MKGIKEWAAEYEARGFALARILHGQKRPIYRGWTKRSFPVQDFREADNIGIQTGGRSGNLVCVDLDTAEAVQAADKFLPPTGMVDGRPGKPRSHHWYRVVNVPEEFTARKEIAGGVRGPKIIRFGLPGGGKGSTIIDFLGTGTQAVVPPSIWTSSDSRRREQRIWYVFDEPAVVDWTELYDCVCRLAAACGWVKKETPPKAARRARAEGEPLPMVPLPPGEVVRQARSYLAGLPPAIKGDGGNVMSYRAACVLVLGFGLSVEEAWPLLLEYNTRCPTPWTADELYVKLTRADEQEGPRGEKIRNISRSIDVHLIPGLPVYLGLDVRNDSRSYINLHPSLWTAIIKLGDDRLLVPELEAVDWDGQRVILAPASTITTNQREVWSEYYLAKRLRERGAEVRSLRIPSREGRRQTLGSLNPAGVSLGCPPKEAWQAKYQADQAGKLGAELSSERRRLPRRRPALDKALDFVRRRKVQALSKEILAQASLEGISRTSIQRAVSLLLSS